MSNSGRALLCLVLTVFACSSSVRAGAILEDATEHTYPVGANPTLTVRNTDGRILVYASEENEITVKVFKRAFSKERLAAIDAKITLEGDAMTIDAYYP